MSVDYAASLSPYDNKGKCGLPEVFDDSGEVREKCRQLAKYLKDSQHVVVHTGAGISTAAGIPDFRGPKGVWTLEKRGETVKTDVTFAAAQPTYTHRALVKLHRSGYVHYIISQNVDGLHIKSGFPRCALSELHGNMFMEVCEKCSMERVLDSPVPTLGKKRTGSVCNTKKSRGVCRGHMRDTVLDWEDDLPEPDFTNATQTSKKADLSICLGTTLQIVPAGNLPLQALKHTDGKLVICNLQPTKHDKKATLLVHARVDDIMRHVLDFLDLSVDDDNAETAVKREPTHSATCGVGEQSPTGTKAECPIASTGATGTPSPVPSASGTSNPGPVASGTSNPVPAGAEASDKNLSA